MILRTYEALAEIRKLHADKKIVFTSGSFDLVHVGHIRYLEACRERGDILVVAVGKDIDIKTHKGDKRPILNEHIRLKTIDSLKPVDYAFLIESPKPNTPPTSALGEVFKILKPDLYILNYDARNLDLHDSHSKEHGIEFVGLQLDRSQPPEFESISTTDIIKKIKELHQDESGS